MKLWVKGKGEEEGEEEKKDGGRGKERETALSLCWSLFLADSEQGTEPLSLLTNKSQNDSREAVWQ